MVKVSAWVKRHYNFISRPGLVLDLACGDGRNGRFLVHKGYNLVFLDKDIAGLSDLKLGSCVKLMKFDLEAGNEWPFEPQKFDGIIVTNYLHRPLMFDLMGTVAPQGVLIYETFAVGNEKFGRPTNPNYLLQTGELLDWVLPAFRILAYEERFISCPKPAVVQRIVAIAKG
ncbi:MAG: SAM-dependent methyltransferase [Rhodospirillaceae bacterium]|nr:SAM-dependent methyltransferase [Rhodospirillaceae bacterium]